QPTAPGMISNTASVAADQVDPVPSNNNINFASIVNPGLGNQATPSLSLAPATVTASAGGTAAAVVTVLLSAPFNQTVTVDYATADGTATAGVDYVAIPPTPLSFA